MGSYDIEFDDSGRPILPKAIEEMHRRAMAATTSRDAARVHDEFLKHETDIIHEFYMRTRKAVDYFLHELNNFHGGYPVQAQQVRTQIQQLTAEALRLRLKLVEIKQFEENDERMFEAWKKEDDLMRHARLSKNLLNQEEGNYKIDIKQLKISDKAKAVCIEAALTLQKIATMLDTINRAFDRKYFSAEDMRMIVDYFNRLLDGMRAELKLLETLEVFERKNIALFEKQIRMDFLVERSLGEEKDFVL